jgi:hypothetical protein
MGIQGRKVWVLYSVCSTNSILRETQRCCMIHPFYVDHGVPAKYKVHINPILGVWGEGMHAEGKN